MKIKNLNFINSFNQIKVGKIEKKVSTKILNIFSEFSKDFKDNNKTLNVLDKNFKLNFKIKKLQKFKKYKTVAIIGMGGSILGAEAIYNFLENKIKKKFYFFNDINEKQIIQFKKKEKLDKTLFIIISKSGNTIETLSNIFSLGIIKKNPKNIIIICEKSNNFLFELSKKFNIFFIEHRSTIGGRYSVLSETGIVPAYFMGININKFRYKLLEFLKGSNKQFLAKSSIILSKFLHSRKYNNLVLLNFSPELEKFLFWYQQLIAESLGKKKMGFMPVVSNAPKDHHSLLQLYLDGPKDKIFYIFSVDAGYRIKTNFKKINKENFLNNKTLSFIKNAQKKALIKSFKKNKISYREFNIKKINETLLSQLFSYFILETIAIGILTNINPFNQPAVEQVKIFTKKILK